MKYVDSKRFGVCDILMKEDINKNLCKCEDIKNAKYKYYLDEKTYKYFAVKKDELQMTFDDLVSRFKFTGNNLEYKKDIGYYVNGDFVTSSEKQIEEYCNNLFERDCDR